MSSNTTIITTLYQIGAVQFGEFTLKSGRLSPIYINLRKIISYPNLLRTISEAMWQKTKGCEFDLVCGVPYTALPIATCMSLDHNIPMIMRRKEKKDYGTKQLIEGEHTQGQRCLIIEDIVTTGSSILETAADLEAAGLKIIDLIALIDREQGGREKLSEKYRLHTILSLSDILQTLLTSNALAVTERPIVEKFLQELAAS
jgi:uridine monophosphate synthetase